MVSFIIELHTIQITLRPSASPQHNKMKEKKKMKKWLIACLLAIALLFVTTAAMAGHTKKNGEYCLGGSYGLLKEYENQHLRRCNDCQEELLENHWVGQEATCIRKAKCGDCTYRFGDYGPHDWGEWKSIGRGAHTRTCKHKSDHVETENCTFSVAPCDDYSPCTKCGAYSKLGHDWGGWTPNGDKTHTHVCTRDPSHTETENCGDFWEADCTTPAMCWYCRGTHGETDPSKHSWDMWESNGDGTHTRICNRERSHTETEDCFGVSCGETDWCNGCWEIYTASHKFDDSWSSTPDEHWKVCLHCKEPQTKALHSFVEQPDEKHLKSEATCVSVAVYYKACSECGYQLSDTFESGTIDANNHDLNYHDAKAPTCTESGWKAYETCKREGCNYTSYQGLDALDHDWEWVSNGNGTHTRTCKNDPSHTETEACSGVGCGQTGTCSVCKGEYTAAGHKYETWLYDSNEHWSYCVYCSEEGRMQHSFAEYKQSEATCTSPAKYLGTCSDCGFYRTYNLGDIDPNNHDLIHHEAKAATCTEIGWEAYDTCSRCDYTTYVELTNGGHSLTHHAAQAATCTEVGWEAYDACSRCDYTTYVELPALGHDYQTEIIPRTCEDDGYTLHTCTRCADRYADTIIPHCGHWYGEWSANGDGTQRAECLRGGCHHEKTVDCEIVELPALNISLCPVCGTASDGSKPALANASVKIVSGRIPHGEALLRVGTLANGEKLLTVGYVYGGQLSKASCQVKITLPAELLAGYTLSLLNADGTETALEYALDGDSAVFTLTFAQPLLAVRLTPAP